jgi:hypothetical protein
MPAQSIREGRGEKAATGFREKEKTATATEALERRRLRDPHGSRSDAKHRQLPKTRN